MKDSVLSFGEGTETAGGKFLVSLQTIGVFTMLSPVLSVGYMGEKVVLSLSLAFWGFAKVTGMSPELSVGGMRCSVRHISPPLLRRA